jgi:dolichol-phosphate mannosyltransferase
MRNANESETHQSQAVAPERDAPTTANPLAKAPVKAHAPLLSIIIPVFNEVSTIDELLRRVVAAPYEKQIIVVDDGSTDGSSGVIADWEARKVIEVCRHAHNRGKGRAIRTALEQALGQFILIQDGDLETDPRDYPFLLEPLRTRNIDIVLGSRFLASVDTTAPFLSLFRVGVSVLNLAVRLLYGVRLSDEACCYKVLRTETLKAMDLQCEGFEFCPEVVAKACQMGLRMEEVAIHYAPRGFKAGKKIRLHDGFVALHCLWKLRRWKHIGRHYHQGSPGKHSSGPLY